MLVIFPFCIISCSENKNDVYKLLSDMRDQEYITDSTKVFSQDTAHNFPIKPFKRKNINYRYYKGVEEDYNNAEWKSRDNERIKYQDGYKHMLEWLLMVPVEYFEIKNGEEIPMVTTYGDYVNRHKISNSNVTLNAGTPCDKESAIFIIENMSELCSSINKGNGDYHIMHNLWSTLDEDKKLQLITSVADAHACLEGRARKLKFIDDLTGAKVAEATPTLGIRVYD